MDKPDQDEGRFFLDLDKQCHEICKNKDVLKRTTERFFFNLLDNITLGIIFDVHRSSRIGTFDLESDRNGEEDEEDSTGPDADNEPARILGPPLQNSMKDQECSCPICLREVTAIRFAPHLEHCMELGRSRLRNASRRIANNNNNNNNNNSSSKERENLSYGSVGSDDDDSDWGSGDKRKKKKDRNNGGVKRGKGTPKKTADAVAEPQAIVDALSAAAANVNVDVEGDVEESGFSSMQMLLQDRSSNGSSPVDSNSSNSSLKKQRGGGMDKSSSKGKKSGSGSKKDRGSPNINLLLE